MGGRIVNNKQSSGRITSGIKPHTLRLSIINFIKEQLSLWRDDPERPPELSEKKLNPQLSKFLNGEARKFFPMIQFNHEEPQFGTRSVDISVSLIAIQMYSKYDPVLVIECKRLPADSPEKKQEYVSGIEPNKKSGGIQRFKLGLHGAKHDVAVMIGYIQKQTANYWYNKINSWILELVNKPIGDGCIWSEKEILIKSNKTKIKDTHSYFSSHKRTAKKSGIIELHHLWITMNKEN